MQQTIDNNKTQIFNSINDIINSQEFTEAQSQFFNKNCSIFTSEEENKHEYYTLFKEYQILLDTSIESKLLEKYDQEDIQKFFTSFQQDYKSYGDNSTIDSLLMFTNFDNFKKTMVDYNQRLNHGKTFDKVQNQDKINDAFQQINPNILDEYYNLPESTWEHKIKGKTNEDIQIWTQPLKDTGLKVIKISYIFKNVDLDTVLQLLILNPNHEEIKKNVNVIEDLKYLEVLNDRHKIIYILINLPMLQRREFIQEMTYHQKGDLHIIKQDSMDKHPKAAENPKIIRAKNNKCVYLKEIDNKTIHYQSLEYQDMKGSIPKLFLNLTVAQTAKKGMEQFYQQCLIKQKEKDQK